MMWIDGRLPLYGDDYQEIIMILGNGGLPYLQLTHG
jgi:hypothetical protein